MVDNTLTLVVATILGLNLLYLLFLLGRKIIPGRKDRAVSYEADEGVAFYVPLMCIITAVYLLTELAFNARLLDVVGGMASEEEIDRIEIAGRLISGVALALAVWGSLIFPRYAKIHPMERNVGGLVFALLISGALSMGAMYKVQDYIINTIVDSSTADQRYAATRLLLLTDATHQQKVQIANIDLSPEVIASPEGKSFLALFPMMGLTVRDLEQRTEDATQEIVRNLVVERIGDVGTLYNETYVPAVRELHELYVEYAKGSNAVLDALDTIPSEQANAWNDYVQSLRRRGYTPSSVPRAGWNRVRQDVRNKGVPVPNNWNPSDRRSFEAAVAEEVRRRAMNKYENEIYQMEAFNRFRGDAPRLGLTFKEFVAHEPIQRELVDTLQLSEIGVRLQPDLDLETYWVQVWLPLVDHELEKQMAVFRADVQHFQEGGAHAADGWRAMKALTVPPVALFFSLVGALVHIFKLANYLLRWILPRWRWRWQVVAVASLVLAFLPTTQSNGITDSSLFKSFEADLAETFHPAVSALTAWVIKAQPYAYPVNEAIRENILLGFSFGYEGQISRFEDE